MGEGREHHFGPIIILLWVLSGLKWGSAPLILREKIIVNLRHGNTRRLFNTPQRDPSYLLRSNCVGALASFTAVAEFQRGHPSDVCNRSDASTGALGQKSCTSTAAQQSNNSATKVQQKFSVEQWTPLTFNERYTGDVPEVEAVRISFRQHGFALSTTMYLYCCQIAAISL